MPRLKESAEARGSGDFEFEPPTEFITFLTLANAITGPSFVRTKFPGMEGTSYPITRYSMADSQPGSDGWYDDGWHVVTGWSCGYGTGTGATLLLYAYKYEGGTEEEQTPRWRLNTWDQMDEKWFPCIADFLVWRSKWLERLPAGWEHAPAVTDYGSDESSEGEEDE